MLEIKEYQLLGKIGEGAFGETWIGSYGAERNPCVIKQLKLNEVERWKAIERFKREATVLESIDHSGVPKYFGFIEETDFVGIVQEHISGKTLEQFVSDNTFQSIHLIQTVLVQGLKILDYLSKLTPSVVHRDISPKNILLDRKHNLYLIDFGGVQQSCAYESETVTCMGTFGYMAPEQLMGKATPRSDLFSFGMVMVYLITGKSIEELPVDSRTGGVDVSEALRGHPERIIKLISKMVAPGAGKRFKSAAQTLKLFQHGLNMGDTDLNVSDISVIPFKEQESNHYGSCEVHWQTQGREKRSKGVFATLLTLFLLQFLIFIGPVNIPFIGGKEIPMTGKVFTHGDQGENIVFQHHHIPETVDLGGGTFLITVLGLVLLLYLIKRLGFKGLKKFIVSSDFFFLLVISFLTSLFFGVDKPGISFLLGLGLGFVLLIYGGELFDSGFSTGFSRLFKEIGSLFIPFLFWQMPEKRGTLMSIHIRSDALYFIEDGWLKRMLNYEDLTPGGISLEGGVYTLFVNIVGRTVPLLHASSQGKLEETKRYLKRRIQEHRTQKRIPAVHKRKSENPFMTFPPEFFKKIQKMMIIDNDTLYFSKGNTCIGAFHYDEIKEVESVLEGDVFHLYLNLEEAYCLKNQVKEPLRIYSSLSRKDAGQIVAFMNHTIQAGKNPVEITPY